MSFEFAFAVALLCFLAPAFCKVLTLSAGGFGGRPLPPARGRRDPPIAGFGFLVCFPSGLCPAGRFLLVAPPVRGGLGGLGHYIILVI